MNKLKSKSTKSQNKTLKMLVVLSLLLMSVLSIVFYGGDIDSGDNNPAVFSCEKGDEKGSGGTFCSEELGFSFELPAELANSIEKSSLPGQSTSLDEVGGGSTFTEAEKTYSHTLKDKNTTFFYSIAIYPKHRMYITNSTNEGSFYYDQDQETFLNSKTKQPINQSQGYKVIKEGDVTIYNNDLKGESVELSQNIFVARNKLIMVNTRTQDAAGESSDNSDINLAVSVRELINKTTKIL